jgi:hypothetical protein
MMDDILMQLYLRQIESGRNVTMIPSTFSAQAKAVESMVQNDKTGLIKSLTEFYVASAAHKFEILTDTPNYNAILKEWLATINLSYNGEFPLGISGIVDEYYRERWAGASFPILKITEWSVIGGVKVPTGLAIVNGSAVKSQQSKLDESRYDYLLDEEELTNNKAVIITKPFGRYYQQYPSIFLVERGILYNYQSYSMMRDHQGRGVGSVLLPYVTRLIKGSPELAVALVKLGADNPGMYSDVELTKIKEAVQAFADDSPMNNKAPLRTSNFDEKFEQFVADLLPLLKMDLTATFEKAMLSGMGFIDVIDVAGASRRESVINPKPFIAEVQKGSNDFVRNILTPLYYKIVEANPDKRYTKTDFTIAHEPITVFMNDKVKMFLRSMYDRGTLSKRTINELGCEVDHDIEVRRRENESRDGTDVTCYPPETTNTEQNVSPMEQKKLDKEPTPDKVGIEANNFNQASVKKATYSYTDHPKEIDGYPDNAQKVWVNVFNTMYEKHDSETRAFKAAWSVLKRYMRNHFTKQGDKWVEKKLRKNNA